LPGAERYLGESLKASGGDLRTAEEWIAIRRARGDPHARDLANEWRKKFPLSDFLREEAGRPDPAHLGADVNRVLNLASEYMRLALYRLALAVLSRDYPASPADESEPGSILPQNHPLVAYFRGYCREKLGQSGSGDYVQASRLSTVGVFPSTAEEGEVLAAAVRADAADATAHYLLGTLYFSRGRSDAAMDEWNRARKLNPRIPVLLASMGRALLQGKREPEQALATFREGVAADPANPALYVGMDQALSLLARPATERVAALEGYPHPASMPTGLLYELILNRAEAGDYAGATASFRHRFFSRQEGGTNVRQVWFEVRLQQTLALARDRGCDTALRAEEQIGSPGDGLEFTRDGLDAMVNSARTNYLLGGMEFSCGRVQAALARFRRAAKGLDPAQIVWARAAAQKLDGFQPDSWRQPLKTALAQAKANRETSAYTGWWVYTIGCLQSALDQAQEAEASFQEALLLPDQMLAHHLTRLARSGAIPK
jgi:tetratricopeptide (TPR) repeat protein